MRWGERIGLCCVCLFLAELPGVRADVIFDLTYIGDAGCGGVDHNYYIGTYEVTVAQYTEFLNAVAASDPYGLYSGSMETDPLGPSITRSGASGSYTYTAVAGKENEPVRWVSLYDGMRLCNWLANGQGSGDTENGSYDLSLGVYTPRNTGATWVIPSESEWCKAAYYDAEHDAYYTYPNGSDDVPAEPTDGTTPREMNFGDDPYWNPDGGTREYFTSIGETTGHSPYGVYDMGGNVEEWTDTADAYPYDFVRVTRGGGLMALEDQLQSSDSSIYEPDMEGSTFGFRIAYIIPEPSTIALLFLGSLGCAWGWMRRRM